MKIKVAFAVPSLKIKSVADYRTRVRETGDRAGARHYFVLPAA